VTSLGGNEYQYSYFLSGFNFNQYEAFDIEFDPTLYSNLSGGVADGSSFALTVLQPNNPPGAHGDYLAQAQVASPPLTGSFTIDFSYSGVGLPGSQSYVLWQFNSNNINVGGTDVGEGTTTAVPEPGAFSLAGLGLLVCLVGWVLHRRRVRSDTMTVRSPRCRFGCFEHAAGKIGDS